MCGFVGLVIKWNMDLKVSTTIVRLATLNLILQEKEQLLQ